LSSSCTSFDEVGYPVWGGALTLVLGALSMGSEYGWGTLKTMLSNRPTRLTFYLAQVATLASAIAVLVVVAFRPLHPGKHPDRELRQ
jgi:ABC-type transport system involved in multi-copper enzyme maturation permease subunit